jgi:hypothetical protein
MKMLTADLVKLGDIGAPWSDREIARIAPKPIPPKSLIRFHGRANERPRTNAGAIEMLMTTAAECFCLRAGTLQLGHQHGINRDRVGDPFIVGLQE